MSDPKEILAKQDLRRREFLKKAGKAVIAAPAVALLLGAGVKSASAQGIGETSTTYTTPQVS